MKDNLIYSISAVFLISLILLIIDISFCEEHIDDCVIINYEYSPSYTSQHMEYDYLLDGFTNKPIVEPEHYYFEIKVDVNTTMIEVNRQQFFFYKPIGCIKIKYYYTRITHQLVISDIIE